MVVYNLHKGGGDCDRKKYHFSTGGLNKRSATASDYSHSGYDEGHLANAEDFAYDCTLDSITFRFWNCCPQTPQLNRGIWKANEEDARGLSQNDNILVLCGSFYGTKTIGNNVFVPETCWKVVYSHTQKKVLMSYIFTNTSTPTMTQIDVKNLNKMLNIKYKIDILHMMR
jgi:endonuclease G